MSPPRQSTSASTTNWQIEDSSHRDRLAEDIAVLQSQLDNQLPSPETTGSTAKGKEKPSFSRVPKPDVQDYKSAPPHMDPRLPVASNLRQAPNADQVFPPRRPDNRITAEDARRLKEMADFEEAEFLLRQSKLVAGSIQSAKSLFRTENLLKADGRNFGDWHRNLAEVGRACLTSATFFFEKCSNSTFEKIGRAVLISSIDQSLVAEMQKFVTCYEMYMALFDKFKTASRAAQMNIWYKFKSFKIDPEGHNAGISSSLKNLLAEWTSVSVTFSADAFLGFIVQAAVMESGAPYSSNFELRVENLVQADKKGTCPTFDAIMNALDVCKEQNRNAAEIASSGQAFASNQPPSALVTSVDQEDLFNVSAFLMDVEEDQWVDALDFYALTASTCWQCGGTGHYARNCPDKSKGDSSK
ncbi:hypothetical protein PTTG_30047 [Puccinia triticina 1-1 BBBD Race 1]|uniref:CCHC-type domain-containing protein n=1 Tax=Puccinia triticina (isolate 1-1 / race 1 (BBBD)) TaxID=630390 RepID=A0A180G0D4_PUCT1|nr:hypothetical protein PTTG_30047 [Puccinia triticina 1-1 BBBD Race 1]